jgi:hypothetical protein
MREATRTARHEAAHVFVSEQMGGVMRSVQLSETGGAVTHLSERDVPIEGQMESALAGFAQEVLDQARDKGIRFEAISNWRAIAEQFLTSSDPDSRMFRVYLQESGLDRHARGRNH